MQIIAEDHFNISNFNSWHFKTDASGMDFRAMLKKRKYQKWAREEAEQEKVDLKEVEKPMPALKKVEKVRKPRFLLRFTHTRKNIVRIL